MNWPLFFQTTFLFWIILDSVGSVPLYVSQLKYYEAKKQRKIILREMLIALVVLLFFFFFGERFFSTLNIKKSALQASGGIILLMISIKMVFAEPHDEKKESSNQRKEPMIVPLAVPAISGPGILATITLYGSGHILNTTAVFFAIILAWILSLPVLLASSLLKDILGQNGLLAIERLFGYIVVLIAAQTTLNGLLAEFHLIAP